MTEPLSTLAAAIERHGGVVRGLSADEVGEVTLDTGVTTLPARYAEFLALMGRQAGPVLAGTDVFYPAIVGVTADARELLAEEGAADLLPGNAVVIGMHQGYQVYWLTDASADDPPVAEYQEGDAELRRSWPSFTAFLADEARRAGLTWPEGG